MAPKKTSKNKQAPNQEEQPRQRGRRRVPVQQQQVEESSEDEVAPQPLQMGVQAPNVRAGMYLNQPELMEATGNLLFSLLDFNCVTLFCTFTSNWYPEVVDQFYKSMMLCHNVVEDDDDDDDVPMIGLSYNINGVNGMITESDLVRVFGMKREGAKDYPERSWSDNWPISIGDCANYLNNNRRAIKSHLVYKYNLNGLQKLVSKVVQGILLPTNSQASELSYIQAFVTWAILNYDQVNFPYIILSHMWHQKSKTPYQYGMILSHLLVNVKNVPVLQAHQSHVKKDSMIGKQSLSTQNVYMWDGGLRSKWEIFEQYEFVRDEVWKFNGCNPPIPPAGWKPSNGEDVIYELPAGTSTRHGEAGSSSIPSDGGMLESINLSLSRLLSDNEFIKGELQGIRHDHRLFRDEMTQMSMHMGSQHAEIRSDYQSLRQEMSQMRIHMGGIHGAMQRIGRRRGPSPPPDDMQEEETHE